MRRIYWKEKNGKRYRVPGVTTILGQLGWGTGGLLWWANEAGRNGLTLDEARESATSVGSRVHEIIEAKIRREKEPFCDWLTPDQELMVSTSLAAFDSWCEAVSFVALETELEMIGDAWDCAGRCDLVARVGGRLSIVDWKTAKQIYPKDIVQVAAYSYLYEEATGTPIECAHILRCDKESGSFAHHAISREMLDRGVQVFEMCLALKAEERALGGAL